MYRERQYDRRDREQAQLQQKIASADPARRGALEQEAQRMFDCRMAEIHRLNFGCIDVPRSQAPLVIEAQQFSAAAVEVFHQAAATLLPAGPLELARDAEQDLITALPWPPSATIASTPRRPGAPSAALRLNH